LRLEALDGVVGIGLAAAEQGRDELALATAYTRLGAVTGLDWAHGAALALLPSDPWERLLQSSLAQGFESIRLAHLARLPGDDPVAALDAWLSAHAENAERLARTINRARSSGAPTAAMLAHLANEARAALG
jgi:glutamate dehydrogenase